MAQNRVIGKDGGLPWRLPGDLALFKRRTTGKAVIMGRRTFDTIKKPLPDRLNIVLTTQSTQPHPGVQVAHHFAQACALAQAGVDTDENADEFMVAGGADIYALALPKADRLYMTLVQGAPEGDVYFPEFDRNDWYILSAAHHRQDSRHSHAWDEFILERKQPLSATGVP